MELLRVIVIVMILGSIVGGYIGHTNGKRHISCAIDDPVIGGLVGFVMSGTLALLVVILVA